MKQGKGHVLTKSECAWEGKLTQGYPHIYDRDCSTPKELDQMFDDLRKAVKEDFPMQKLYEDPETVRWDYVSCWVELTESQLREFKDYLNWYLIKQYYKNLSEDFKREFADRL